MVARYSITVLLPCVDSCHYAELNPNMKSRLPEWCSSVLRGILTSSKVPRWPSVLSLLLVRTIKCDVCQIYNSPLCVFVCVCTHSCLFDSEQMWTSAVAVKAINTCLEVFVRGCVWFSAPAVVIGCVLCFYTHLCKMSDILDFKYTFVFMRHGRWERPTCNKERYLEITT